MAIGKRRTYLTIQEKDADEDFPFNESPGHWRDFWNVLCKLEPLSGVESPIANQTTELLTHRIEMTWEPKLDELRSDMRGIVAGPISYRIFNFRSDANIDTKNRTVIVMAVEGRPEDRRRYEPQTVA
jgi:hypothetical protein